jgi:hypothetical protein
MENAVQTIEYFLFDLFGLLIPGMAVVCLVAVVLDPFGGVCWLDVLSRMTGPGWCLILLLAYVIGSGLQGLGEGIEYLLDRTPYARLPWHQTYREMRESILGSKTYLAAREQLATLVRTELKGTDFREVRNLAMSLAPNELRPTRQFMYYSQLCLGTATGLLLVVAVVLVKWGVECLRGGCTPNLAHTMIVGGMLLLTAAALMNRRQRFYSISMRIPFSIALVKLAQGSDRKAEPTSGASARPGDGLP